MKRLLLALAIFPMALASIASDSAGLYRLRPGDAILLSVWRDEALQKEAKVLPDGSITLPLVGRVEVAGLSTPEAEQRIAAKLKEYVQDPIVSVVVTSIEGNRAYVLGKVGKPGPIAMTGPTTVLQALAIAGGLDKFADEGSIKIVRIAGDAQQVITVNYKSLAAGRDMSTNVVLRAGDTIVVP